MSFTNILALMRAGILQYKNFWGEMLQGNLATKCLLTSKQTINGQFL